MTDCGEGDTHDEPEEAIVITPGGPRPADSVHPVRPGERLRQLADGTFVVEPDPRSTDSDADEEDDAHELGHGDHPRGPPAQ